MSFARDPLHPPTYSNLAMHLPVMGRAAEAREMLQDLRRFLPGSASLQGAMGRIELFAGNQAEAGRLFEAAVAAEPLNFVERLWYSVVLFATRQYARLEEIGADRWAALALSRMGRTEEALMRADRAVRNGDEVSFYLQVLAENGRFGDLVAYVESRWSDLDAFERDSTQRDGFGSLGLILIAQAYGRLDREAEFFSALRQAREALAWQTAQGADNSILTLSRAALASLEGDRESALALLDRAVAAGALPALDLEGTFSLFEPLQGDPRFDAILQRIREDRNAERAELGLDPILS
jgi:tetratricopeptide (TPR) repeat protein